MEGSVLSMYPQGGAWGESSLEEPKAGETGDRWSIELEGIGYTQSSSQYRNLFFGGGPFEGEGKTLEWDSLGLCCVVRHGREERAGWVPVFGRRWGEGPLQVLSYWEEVPQGGVHVVLHPPCEDIQGNPFFFSEDSICYGKLGEEWDDPVIMREGQGDCHPDINWIR